MLGHVAFLMSLPCLVLATLFKTQFMYASLYLLEASAVEVRPDSAHEGG